MAKTRSPNFPFVPLEEAIQRAGVIWQHESRHPAAPETIVGHWNYAPKSSGGRQTLAALRQFGLLEGRGQVKLSELAQAILFSEEGSDAWLQRVQEAALNPTIHQEIWSKYQGESVSDQNLRYYLVVERGFAERGAAELIQEYRATMAYARMSERRDNLPPEDEDNTEDEAQNDDMSMLEQEDRSTSQRAGARSVQLPYSSTGWATLNARFPLSDAEWNQMLSVLTAMKPALTQTPSEPADAE